MFSDGRLFPVLRPDLKKSAHGRCRKEGGAEKIHGFLEQTLKKICRQTGIPDPEKKVTSSAA
jgi:hypothetical protein